MIKVIKTIVRNSVPLTFSIVIGFFCLNSESVMAWQSEDGSFEIHGYFDNTTHSRAHSGLSKMRNRAVTEFTKSMGNIGILSDFKIQGTLRASYDAVYDLNDDHWGDKAGGPVALDTLSGATEVPWGSGLAPTPFFGFNTASNPNQGLRILNSEHTDTTGSLSGVRGLQFAYPVQPCDVDPRGCIDGYMDASTDDLRFPEFNDRLDWLRELYFDFDIPIKNGDRVAVRLGRQQVVWGRTDLFRVLDQINPIDFSIQNIYEPFEDSRIPMGILNTEYQMGATGPFASLNFQLVWNFEQFRPHNLGQGGQPYSILDAGNLFRALNTCWDYGCTVGNFFPVDPVAGPAIATDFAPGTVGIRRANMPNWSISDSQLGLRTEGEIGNFGFSLNALYYYQQLPSLHAMIPSTNPFTGATQRTPYLPAFDIEFPRVMLFGGSLDTYVDPLKSVFRVEIAHTSGEEFANTLEPALYSESNVIRWVVGWDRPTWIKFLNSERTFLLSAQIFGQHILDHELIETPLGPAGMPAWEDNFIFTFLIEGNYLNDRLTPSIVTAYDLEAEAGAIAPSLTWRISNNLVMGIGANIKFGSMKNEFDDLRIANQFPPFTGPANAVGQTAIRTAGYEPLGRFRSGVFGMAEDEDEIMFSIRYQY